MHRKPNRRGQWAAIFAILASALGVIGFGGAFAAAHAATTPLQVKLGTQVAGDGSSAVFNANGDIVLTVGTGTSTTGAWADITSAKGAALPTTEPSFKTDHYAAGSPRFVIELSNGHSLWGYPGLTLSGKTGPDAAGMAWAVNNGNTYTDYATAVTGATNGASGVTVTDAFIVADGDQAPGTADTVTDLQYNGQVLGGGVVTLTQPSDVSDVLGTAIVSVKLVATSTVSNPVITYAASGLPTGLTLKGDTISGTPTSTGTSLVTVTATDAYGDHASQSFKVDVTATAPTTTAPYVYGGSVVTVNNNRATVTWSDGGTWPNKSQCVEVWISGYGFGAWNPADPTNPGTSHVGFTCNNGNQAANLGYLSGLARNHTYALRIVPATGVYGNNHPIPGANVGYVDVFTSNLTLAS